MDFKDLIKRYQSGTATPEERQIVEGEIEKNEAINDYLSREIMEALPSATMTHKIEARKIKGRMNRKLAAVAAVSILSVLLIFFLVQFVIFPFVNSRYYSPLDGRINVVGINEWGQMSIDLSVFSELHLQGFEIPFVFTKPEGLGKYDLTLYRYDSFRSFSETQFRSSIVRGKLDHSALGDALSEGLALHWVQLVYGHYTDSEKIDRIDGVSRAELSRLPESAQVKAYLFFDQAIEMQTLAKLVTESSLRVLWAGIQCKTSDSFWTNRFGFSPLGKYIPLTQNAYDPKQYPLLELDDSEPMGGVNSIDFSKLTAEAYETHFISMLRYMAEKEDFMDVIGYSYDYAEALSYVEEHGVWCQGVVVSGSRDELTALLDDSMIQYIAIDDVMVSVFARN